MFKKLLVVLSLGVALAGCGEKKEVTEDMLIGNWQCKTIIAKHSKYDENGNLQETRDITNLRKPIHASYKKESNSLTLAVNEFTSIPFSLSDERYGKFQEISKCIDDKVNDVKVEPKYIFISDDEFNVISRVQARTCKSKKLFENFYTEQNCKRDK